MDDLEVAGDLATAVCSTISSSTKVLNAVRRPRPPPAQRVSQESGRLASVAIGGGRRSSARSASVTCSRTSRTFVRNAIQTSWSLDADLRTRSPRGPPAHVGERPFDGAQHIGDGDLVCAPGEPVTAVAAALAHDDVPALQIAEDLLQERGRDPLALRDRLGAERLAGGGRELERGAYRAVRLGGDAHGRGLWRMVISTMPIGFVMIVWWPCPCPRRPPGNPPRAACAAGRGLRARQLR